MAQQVAYKQEKSGFSWGWLIFGIVVVATVGGTIVVVSLVDRSKSGLLGAL